jgi:hypothetical protein
MIGLTYTTNSYRVLTLMSGVLIVCLMAMAFPSDSFACHRNTADGVPKPHGPNDSCDSTGGDSGGNTPQVIGLHQDTYTDGAPLWAPTDASSDCVMQKNSGKSLSGAFPRHELCASLPENSVSGAILRDDIIVIVQASNRGEVLSVEVQGQDYIGTVGIVHISDVMAPSSVDRFDDGSMVIHVHANNVGLYKCDTHILKKQSNCDQKVGEFALDDLFYSPDP